MTLHILPAAPTKESLKKKGLHRRAKECFWHLRSIFRAGDLLEVADEHIELVLVNDINDVAPGSGAHLFKRGEILTYLGCRTIGTTVRRYFSSVENIYAIDEPIGYTCQWAFVPPTWYTQELETLLNTVTTSVDRARSKKARSRKGVKH